MFFLSFLNFLQIIYMRTLYAYNSVTLLTSPRHVVTEQIRKIVCDKYGIEGDVSVMEMINEIYDMLERVQV